jgi:hypothetical protein
MAAFRRTCFKNKINTTTVYCTGTITSSQVNTLQNMSPDLDVAETLEEGFKRAEESPLDSPAKAATVRSERNKWYALGIVACGVLLAVILPTTVMLLLHQHGDEWPETDLEVELEFNPKVDPRIETDPEGFEGPFQAHLPSFNNRIIRKPYADATLLHEHLENGSRSPKRKRKRKPSTSPSDVTTTNTSPSFLQIEGPFQAKLALFNDDIVGQPYADPALLQEDLKNAARFLLDIVVKRNTNVKGFENVGFGGQNPNSFNFRDDVFFGGVAQGGPVFAASPPANASAQGPTVDATVNDFGTNNQETDVEEGDVIVSDGERGKQLWASLGFVHNVDIDVAHVLICTFFLFNSFSLRCLRRLHCGLEC